MLQGQQVGEVVLTLLHKVAKVLAKLSCELGIQVKPVLKGLYDTCLEIILPKPLPMLNDGQITYDDKIKISIQQDLNLQKHITDIKARESIQGSKELFEALEEQIMLYFDQGDC